MSSGYWRAEHRRSPYSLYIRIRVYGPYTDPYSEGVLVGGGDGGGGLAQYE